MPEIDINIQDFSSKIGISQNELIKESLLLFAWNKLKYVQLELYSLQKKYQVNTVFEFEKLYETGKIEEADTFEDYQKFDRLCYEQELFEQFIKKLSLISHSLTIKNLKY